MFQKGCSTSSFSNTLLTRPKREEKLQDLFGKVSTSGSSLTGLPRRIEELEGPSRVRVVLRLVTTGASACRLARQLSSSPVLFTISVKLGSLRMGSKMGSFLRW